jgi:hypothetical protein
MTSYWISDICILFNSFEINPFRGTDRNFRYNALTRLIILTTVLSAILFGNFKEVGVTGLISLIISVLIYFVSFNRDLNYEKREPLESTEKSDISNASNFEKVKLSDEDVNKKNLSIVRYRPGIDTDNLSRVLFVDNKKPMQEYDDINSEKYNIAPRSRIVTGSKVYNTATKDDMTNNPRVSEISFTI